LIFCRTTNLNQAIQQWHFFTIEVWFEEHQLLEVVVAKLEIVITVEIGQTEQEGFLIGCNLLSYIVSHDIAFSIDGLVHSQNLA